MAPGFASAIFWVTSMFFAPHTTLIIFFESFTSTNDNLSASGCFSILVISPTIIFSSQLSPNLIISETSVPAIVSNSAILSLLTSYLIYCFIQETGILIIFI